MSNPDCSKCDGTGFEVVGDNTVRPCDCETIRLADVMERAGVGARERGFDDAGLAEGHRVHRDRAMGFLRVGTSVLLHGPTGSGKTGLAVCLLKVSALSGKTIAWCHVDTWLRQVRETFDRKGEDGERLHSEGELLASLLEADIVVVDDLGANRPTEWAESMLYAVVAGRDSTMKGTVYTTNLPMAGPKSVEAIYGDRIKSRLDRCVKFPIKAESDRRKEPKRG